MYKIFKLSLRLQLSLCSLFFLPYQAQAADLMDIFRSARDHDPSWEATKLQFEAEKQRLALSESALYPKVVSSATIQDIETSGSGVAIINPVYLDQDILLDCLIQANDGDACNPPLTIRDDIGGSYNTYTITVQLTQPLYNYKFWRNYNKAKILDEASFSSFESAQQDLILAIAKAYFSVLEAHEQWELSKTDTESAEKQLEQTTKGHQLGLLPQNDVYDTRTALDLKRVELLIAKTTLENTQETLMLMTQRRDVSLATLSEALIVEAPQPRNVEEWVKKGLKHNRKLLAAHSNTLAAEQEVAIKKGGYHPEIDLIAGYQVSKNDQVAIVSAPSVRQSGIGVQLRYPLYLGGQTTAEVTGAKLLYQRSTEDYESVRRDVIRKVRNSYRKVNNDVRGVEAAEQAIHSSKKSLEAALAAYSDGTRPLVMVLKAQSDWFRAKKDHASARYNYILDSLDLKYVAGTLAIEDLQVVNSWLSVDKLILPPGQDLEDEVKVDLFY